jgi:hypothetical protein
MIRIVFAAGLAAGAAFAHADELQDCSIDGRLKGVKIGTEQFRKAVSTFPHQACVASGPNGVFLVTVHGVQRLKAAHH